MPCMQKWREGLILMDLKEIKEKSRHFLVNAWVKEIGQDFDSPYMSDPDWVKIRKVLQAIDKVE